MKRLFHSQAGHVLVLALIALAAGSLLITPFLRSVSNNVLLSEQFENAIEEQYASDAGVEEALWHVSYGDYNETVLDDPGDSTSFPSGETINGVDSTVSITRDWIQYVVEDYESGGWSGGTGWLAPWTTSGDAVVQTAENPHEGSYHLRIRNSGYAARSADLSAAVEPRLYFWVRVDNFNQNDSVDVKLSSDGVIWTTAKTWTNANNNNSYQFVEIDLAAYGPSSTFWIAFQGDLNGASRQFFVDYIVVANPLLGAQFGLPSDSFESADLQGGSGWLGDWQKTGNAEATTQGTSNEGSYHLQVKAAPSSVERSVDLSGRSELRLQFWAKLTSLEDGEYAEALVSSDHTNWTVVKTWTSADSGQGYQFVDIDLSPFTMSSEFWIAFNSGFSQGNDFLYVDAVKIVGPIAYQIVVDIGDSTITVNVTEINGVTTIISWESNETPP